MKRQQKYFTEVSVLQATMDVILIKPAEFDKIKIMDKDIVARIEKAHIYFVCQRPRVRIGAAKDRGSEGIRITLNISNEANTMSKEIIIPAIYLPHNATSARPFESGAYFTFTNGKDDITSFMPPEILLKLGRGLIPELDKLEILYIGQAYGDSGARSAIDRLKSHSTLQKVLADQAHTCWWMEPVILMFTYDQPRVILKMDGRGTPEISGNADMSHFKSLQDEPLSDAQLVTIAEASLIRYFKPRYNVHFKGNYPTSEMQHLRDAYRLDYNAIVTEIDTEDIRVSTFTNHQKISGHHIAQFDLHDPNERFSFFEFTSSGG